jgi:aspartate-semialdehyde dehydrogenase
MPNQSSFDICPIWIPLVSSEVSAHREDQYDVTGFYNVLAPNCSVFTLQMALAVGAK